MTFLLMRRLSSSVIGRGVGSGSLRPANSPATAAASSSCISLNRSPVCSMARLELAVLRGRQAVEQEPVAEHADDGVLRVVGLGAAEDQSELAFPVEGLAAVGSEMPHPFAVIDLAQGVEHFGQVVPVQAEHRGEVFQHQDAERADLA